MTLVGTVLHDSRRRRRAGYALAAALVVGWVLVQVAWLNPWRLLVLEPLSGERATWAIWGSAAALGAVTVLVGLRRRLALPVAGVVVALALLVAGVVGLNRNAYGDAEPGFRQTSETVAATSADGRLVVVTTAQHGDDDADFWYEEYHVESREGLRSRRSDFIAVLDHPLDAPGPRIGSVRFVGDRAVEMTTSDGRQWTVALDPDTVGTTHWLHTCEEKGGLCLGPLPEDP